MDDPSSRLSAALEGRYAIERELGQGGMATVYLARDLKHNRSVALKVLKPELSAVVGAERFLAEIETTANLAHPHILPLHDSGEADGLLYYVMPYVEGESLREKLDREHQLPVDDAVRIAADVAEALDYAHRHGVIHRDIKPANIMILDGRPLIADFGIALAVGSAGGARLTETGLSVGTPFYMSPEQATGEAFIGPSADIYALGCVLYEMLVGEPPFAGASAQAVLAKIIAGGSVSATAARKTIPEHVDATIRKALEKIPADRFKSARAFAEALADPGFRYGEAAAAAAGDGWKGRALGLGLLAAMMTVLAMAGWLWRPAPEERASGLRIAIQMREGQRPRPGSEFALTGDGNMLAYTAAEPANISMTRLYLRRMDARTPALVEESEYARQPAFSPDGTQVAVNVSGSLKVIPLDGGPSRIVADSLLNGFGWSQDGEFFFYNVAGYDLGGGGGLRRVPANGGVSELASYPDTASGHDEHAWPSYLPGVADHILVEILTNGPDSVGLLNLETGRARALVEGEAPRYSGTGHILYALPGNRGSRLMALPFDLARLEVTGTAIPVLENLTSGSGFHSFGVATSGRIIAMTWLDGQSQDNLLTPVWVDRRGDVTVIDPDWRVYPGNNNRGMDISPDGSRVAISIVAAVESGEDVWVKQLPRGPFVPVTREPGQDVRPKWSNDGRHILYISERAGSSNQDERADVWRRRADGIGEPELVMDLPRSVWEVEPVPGGEWLVGRIGGFVNQGGDRDIVIRGPEDEQARSYWDSEFDEKAIAVSPDGRWLAYESEASGRTEVYVRPFPNVNDGRYAVSQQGGTMPEWGHRSNELYFVGGDREMMVARYSTEGGDFRVTEVGTLFDLPAEVFYLPGEQYSLYDVAPDDQRFLWLAGDREAAPIEVLLLDDWAAGPSPAN